MEALLAGQPTLAAAGVMHRSMAPSSRAARQPNTTGTLLWACGRPGTHLRVLMPVRVQANNTEKGLSSDAIDGERYGGREHVYDSMNDMEAVGLVEGSAAAAAGGIASAQEPSTKEEEAKDFSTADLDIAMLLRTIQEVETKNLELQKQLGETVSLLGVAARAVESRQAAEIASNSQPPAQSKGDTVNSKGDAVNGKAPPQTAAVASEAIMREQESEPNTLGGMEEDDTRRTSSVIHPGALCSTTTSVGRDFENNKCIITIRIVAERTDVGGGGGQQVQMPHLVALAGQALVGTSSDFSRAQNRELAAYTHTERRMNNHKHIRSVLRHGAIVNAEHNGTSQFGHDSFVVNVKDPSSERVIKALFKPRVPGDAQGWHRAPIEAVAYKLNIALGMDYVPPVVYRTGGVDVDYQHFAEGAFIYYANNAVELKDTNPEEWGVSKDVLLSDTRILDVLIHNSDRHHGHFLRGEHWVEGQWVDGTWVGNQRPVLIDHAAGFRKEALVTMEHENAFQTGAVKCVSAKTFLRLRFLDAASIASNFSHYLNEREMRDLLMRRNTILRYLDNLVDKNGYANTVVE